MLEVSTKMNTDLKEIIVKLVEIRRDIDAVYHHQTDRIVRELDDVIQSLRNSNNAELKTCQ